VPPKNVPFGLAEITANDTDGVYAGKKAGRQRKMSSRTPEYALSLTKGCFERIKGNGSNNC